MTVGRNPLALIRRAAWPAAGLLIIAYFLGAAVVGENGVLAWGDYRRAKAERGAELARLETERARLAHRSDLLDPRNADPDLADEMVRSQLGYVRPDEVIIQLDDAGRRPPRRRSRAARSDASTSARSASNAGAMLRVPRVCRHRAAVATEERAESGQGSIAEARREGQGRRSAPPADAQSRAPARAEALQGRARTSCSNIYRQMLLIRRFEERAGQLYGLGLIGGFCHLYIGQEAVAVGLQSALSSARTASSPAIATMATCSPTASIPR